MSECEQETLDCIKVMVRQLNPKAKIIPASHCAVDLREVLNTSRFDLDTAMISPLWEMMCQKEELVPETEEYGVSLLFTLNEIVSIYLLLLPLFLFSPRSAILSTEREHRFIHRRFLKISCSSIL